MYIFVCVCVCVCIYIYIYIYIAGITDSVLSCRLEHALDAQIVYQILFRALSQHILVVRCGVKTRASASEIESKCERECLSQCSLEHARLKRRGKARGRDRYRQIQTKHA